MPGPLRIRTPRLELIAATVELARAEMTDKRELACLLDAEVPGLAEGEGWPPESTREAAGLFAAYLERDPEIAGWLSWYWVLVDEKRTLIGYGGFTSRPVGGIVAIGYSLLPAYQGKGYATEAVQALTTWAFSHPEVRTIIAEVVPDNLGSIAVLEKAGFERAGEGSEKGHIRYGLDRWTKPLSVKKG